MVGSVIHYQHTTNVLFITLLINCQGKENELKFKALKCVPVDSELL